MPGSMPGSYPPACHTYDIQTFERERTMNKVIRDITLAYQKVNPTTIKLILLVVSLTAFVISGGAPDGDGGIGFNPR
jgi:hypothetical protein